MASERPESQLAAFTRFCESSTGRELAAPAAMQAFSVADFRRFWSLFLDWSALLCHGAPQPVCTDDRCEDAIFFPHLMLNYAENLLRIDSPEAGARTALVAHHAFRPPTRLSRAELRERVLAVASHLRRMGVGPGDRVAAMAGNDAEAVVAGLATAAVGATFSCAAPDMGAPAVLSRFTQLAPKVLMADLVDHGEPASVAMADRVGDVVRGLPSLTALIALDDGPVPPRSRLPVERLAELAYGRADAEDLGGWTRFPFNHPLFVLFSSGTTGAPKCIVHGAGGTLLEHLKEHRLHVDLRPEDRLFFRTSTAWMMWNWQLSALAVGVPIVLHDGPIAGPDALWRVAAAEDVTVLGTSPAYLQLCQDSGYSPRTEVALPHLRSVLSTGAVLHDWQYDWFREHVGRQPLQSISGGTDIVGCFVLGHPDLPVKRGWIQCRSLGLDVQAAPAGTPPGHAGELVCRNPFPSRPLGFLGDRGRGFHEAYFAANPAVWTHGDVIEFDADGGARVHGRSDGVLNINGVRIGPADIYRALRRVPEVREAVAVEQRASDGRSRVVLLLVLHEPAVLDGRLSVRIRREIVHHVAATHVPELVVRVHELPVTHNGKRSDRAVRDAVDGRPLVNAEALANPRSAEAIRQAVQHADRRRHELTAGPGRPDDASTEQKLRAIWEGVLGVAPLRPDDNFFDVGGTSLAAVRLFQAVHELLGVDLPLSTLVRAQTPLAMAAVIDSPPEERVPSVVRLRTGNGARPLFFIHSVSGDVLQLRTLALGLVTDRPVYGIQARGVDPGNEPHDRVEEMAESYTQTIRSLQPEGPYALAGHSFGGLAAFETAVQLERLGESVEFLGLIDTCVDHRCLARGARARFVAARPFRCLGALARLGKGRRVELIRGALTGPTGWREPSAPAPTLPPLLRRVESVNRRALARYRPGDYYGGSVSFFCAEVRGARTCDPLPVWRRVVKGGLSVTSIPGDHTDVIREPNLTLLADRFSEELGS